MNATFCAAMIGVTVAGATGFSQSVVKGVAADLRAATTPGATETIGSPAAARSKSVRHNSSGTQRPKGCDTPTPSRQGPLIVILDFSPGCRSGCDSGDAVAYYAYQEAQGFYQPGYAWGAGIRGNTLAWGDFLPYLEEFILNAPPTARDAFRRGFIEAFGGNAEATYDYAFRQAARPG